jgi:hypothetical protein
MGLPRDRWKLLAMARRQWAEIELPFDCRLLKTVAEEAPLLAEEMGFASGEDFLTDYLGLDLELVRRVLGWLEQEQPTEAVPLQLAIEQAKEQPLAAPGAIGNGRADESRVANRHSKPANQLSSDSQERLLRRIARDQPELLDQIGPDKPHRSARAAAIAAGIIKPVPTVRLVDDLGKVAAALRKHLSVDQLSALVRELAS